MLINPVLAFRKWLTQCRLGCVLTSICLLVATFGNYAYGGNEAQGKRKRDASPDSPVRIELLSDVGVRQSEVTLGDVAHLTTRDMAAIRQLVDLSLGLVPRTGEVVRLKRENLVRWIRARTGIEMSDIVWTGADTSNVHLVLGVLSGDKVASTAEKALRAALAKQGLRADIETGHMPTDVRIPRGKIALKVRQIPESAVLASHVSVWVDIWVDKDFVRTVPVDFDLAVFGPAYVATQDISLGQRLRPSVLQRREVRWSGRNAPPLLAADDELSTLQLRRPLTVGGVLTRGHVKTAPMVARGGWATLRATEGMVRIESRVEVLQDGASGQLVRVRLPDSASSIVAQVTGPGVVEVRQ